MTTKAGAGDRIASVRMSSCDLPLATPISDAKVLTGRQKPMTEIAMLFAEIEGPQLDPRTSLVRRARLTPPDHHPDPEPLP